MQCPLRSFGSKAPRCVSFCFSTHISAALRLVLVALQVTFAIWADTRLLWSSELVTAPGVSQFDLRVGLTIFLRFTASRLSCTDAIRF